jgi:hypothetical protein
MCSLPGFLIVTITVMNMKMSNDNIQQDNTLYPHMNSDISVNKVTAMNWMAKFVSRKGDGNFHFTMSMPPIQQVLKKLFSRDKGGRSMKLTSHLFPVHGLGIH